MKTVEEHLAHCLDGRTALSALELQLLEAQGGILAEQVVAGWDLPVFDAAEVDGYAVRASDVAPATSTASVQLPVVGDVSSGSSGVNRVQAGLSARIRIGEPLPQGADAVVPLAATDGGLAEVRVVRGVAPGENVRRRGTEVRAGQVVLEAGSRLGPAHVGMLAALGRDRVLARPRPRVIVLAVGDDLVEPGHPMALGQHIDANSYLLTAAARASGAVAFRVGIVPDQSRRLSDAVEDQLIRADLVLISVGAHDRSHDVVREVLSRLGRVSFDTVAMRPGAPQGFGLVGPDSTPIFTLPGDPGGAYISFEVFVRPVIRRMLGVEPLHRPAVGAVLTADIDSMPGVREFVRARLAVEEGRYVVAPLLDDGHALAALSAANAFIAVPEQSSGLNAGDPVTVMVLERRLA